MQPTETEILLRQTFFDLGFPVITDHLFCFHCGNHYSTAGMGFTLPDSCRFCHKTWDVGEVAYPDVIIEWHSWNANKNRIDTTRGIVRVDGYELHHRSKQAINRDFFQVQNFRKHDIRVFIVYNTELSTQEERTEFARRVITMMQASE